MRKNLLKTNNSNNFELANLYMNTVISTLEKSLDKEKDFRVKKLIYEKIIESYRELEKFL